MAKNRSIPFGYCMNEGNISTNKDEVYWVSRIFAEYLAGKSMSQIATIMMENNISYHTDNTTWNKNIIKRIIENDKYLGNDTYPQIVSEDTFRAANEKKLKKATSLCTIPDEIADMRNMAYCKECGHKLIRTGGNNKYIYWNCKNPDCFPFDHVMTDQMITSAVLNIMNSAIANPSLIKTGGTVSTYEPDKDVIRLQNEISHKMDMGDIDYDNMKADIIKLAEMKYQCCSYDDRLPKTKMLLKLLSDRPQLEELDTALLKIMARRVIISHYCSVELELLNGEFIRNTTERSKNNERSDQCYCNTGDITTIRQE